VFANIVGRVCGRVFDCVANVYYVFACFIQSGVGCLGHSDAGRCATADVLLGR